MLPNKRLKLAGPAFKGDLRLCTKELLPQGAVLAPAGARPQLKRDPLGSPPNPVSNATC